MKLTSVLAGLIAAGLLGACVAPPPYRPVPRTVVVAPAPPPRVIVEQPPPMPGPPDVYVWRPGHWQWNGVRYVWVNGVYIARPRPGATWEPDHWQRRGNEWVLVQGHWR